MALTQKDFPQKEFLITDFGAVCSDMLQTEAIQEAIDRCFLAGGGRVIVPAKAMGMRKGMDYLCKRVDIQKPDGDFPTVESPNPENFEAFTLAVEYAKEQTPDIIFGTDPDSDRIGVVVRSNNGEYIPLNGNETGCLLCEFILKKLKEKQALDKNGAIVKTIVTTESVREIANSYEIETIDVLTGFKFIGEKIKEFEADKKRTFIFGLEESYGYLKGTYARDKDAVVAAMLVCEMAACYKSKGMTLYDGLKEIYRKYGYFSETLMTKTLVGIDGIKQISKIMHKFRTENLPINVIDMVDYNLGIAGLPKADVIKFFTSDGWLAVRPSGTEPKIKFYFGVKSKASKEDADTKLHTLKNTIVEFLN